VVWTKTGSTTWSVAKLANNGTHLGKANFTTTEGQSVGCGLSPVEMMTFTPSGPPAYVRDCGDDTVATWAQ
jgi:hypothetical protein